MTTAKQTAILDALRALNSEGVEPTVRSLADRLEGREHRSERFSDDEIRGLLARLAFDGLVEQIRPAQAGEPIRFKVSDEGSTETPDSPAA